MMMKNILFLSLLFFQQLMVQGQSIPLDRLAWFSADGNGGYTGFATSFFEYNDQKLLRSQKSIYINPFTGDTLYQNRTTYTYNEKQQRIKSENDEWYAATGTWDTDNIELTSYGSNLKADTVAAYYFNVGVLNHINRTVFQYDNFDLVREETADYWENSSQSWTGVNKKGYTYTPAQELETKSYYQYSEVTSRFEPVDSFSYAYGQGLLLKTTSLSWTDGKWQLSSVALNKYDEKKLIRTRVQVFDADANRLIDDYKDTLYYDATNELIKFVRHDWYPDLQRWYNSDSILYQNDAFHDVTAQIEYYGTHLPADGWEPKYKTELFYNTVVDFSSVIWPFEDDEITTLHFTKQLLRILEYDYAADWEVQDKYEYYYGEPIVGTIAVEQVPDAVYPNPASTEIRLTLSGLNDRATLELYTTEGRIVAAWNIAGQDSFSVAHFPPGTYFYLIRNGDKNFAGKLIIQ